MRLLRLIIISLIGLWPTVNAWSQIPPFFNNLQYWTRADSISALGNPNIVVLPDFSDGLHNAPIQSGATQATLLFEGEFNVPALQFSSATRYNLPNINVKSAIVVCKITDYPASGTVRLLTRNAAANGLYNAFNGYLANFTGASCGGTRTILSTNPKYVIYSVSSGDGTNPGVMRVDFTSQLIDPCQGLINGAHNIGHLTNGFTGNLKEILVYDHVLSEVDISEIENYLLDYYVDEISLPEMMVTDNLCPIPLTLGKGYDEILWSTGEISNSIEITRTGSYSVEAIDIFGRIHRDTVQVTFPGTYISSFSLCTQTDSLYTTGLEAFNVVWQDGSTTTDYLITEGGEYSLTVTNDQGCSYQSDTVIVTEDFFPTEVELHENPNFCLGNDLFLASGFAEAESFLWSTEETAPFIEPQESGTYWVEATNANGCVGRDTVDVDIVGVAPTAAFDVGLACQNTPLVLSDATVPEDGTVVSWEWELIIDNGEWIIGNGEWLEDGGWILENGAWVLVIDGEDEPSVVLGQEGPYGIRLTVTLDNGCTGTVRDTLDIQPQPTVGFNYDVVIPCAGNPVAFQSQSFVPDGGTILNYAWAFGNGTTAIGAAGITTFENQGPNSVRHIVSSTAGCSDSLEVVVAVLGSPVTNFELADVCVGQPVIYQEDVDESESGPVFYNWQFGDGFFSNFPNTSHVYPGVGEFWVTLTATGNSFGNPGCVDAVTKSVRVYPAPTGSIEIEDACLGEPLRLVDMTEAYSINGQIDPIASRSWVSGSVLGVDSVVTWIPAETGLIPIQFSALTAAGCQVMASATATVLAPPLAEFELNIPLQSPPLVISTNNLSSGAAFFAWYDGDGQFLSADFEPSFTYPEAGKYAISLLATNELNCVDSASQAFSLIVPTYDLALIDIRYTIEDGKLFLRPLISNNGNVRVERFDVTISLGRSAGINYTVDFAIEAGALVEVDIDLELEYFPARDLPFVCMEISAPNGFLDQDESNNSACVGLDKVGVHFLLPFPNPTDGVVQLGFVVPKAGKLEVEVISTNGKQMDSFALDLEAGYSLFPYDTRGFTEGVYFFRFNLLGDSKTFKIVRTN